MDSLEREAPVKNATSAAEIFERIKIKVRYNAQAPGIMITLAEVLLLHGYFIRDFGGADGVRDNAGPEAAVARPYATFSGEDL